MDLLDYQESVLADLSDFLYWVERLGDSCRAFERFWSEKGVARPEPWRSGGLPNEIPNVCIKVPTGGGKTFMAAHALGEIFDRLEVYRRNEPRAVVWLVPSNAILSQTLRTLGDPSHPYRQAISRRFNGRVAVYSKEQALQGAEFNAATVADQLSLLVLSYASFRASNKEGRKAYQENGNLQSFVHGMRPEDVLADTDESALINVLRSMRPVVIVDESHNAGAPLSREMVANFNPSFVLELTATPRKESNIVSYVDAAKLKGNHMVKLPVIVYNHHTQREVINSAIQFRARLESQAEAELAAGGDYIRPIVLFQAEPEKDEEATTFRDVKERLIQLGIPAEQIAIKTASVDELKGHELLSRTCPIRFIITVNALKEGWDCPFAYILATIANRHSSVDVEQILGRVLRQPYARRHHNNLLNNSYVLASSAHFLQTLNRIVAGLNQAGFSSRDVRARDSEAQLEGPVEEIREGLQLALQEQPAAAPSVPGGGTLDPAEWKPADVGAVVNDIERLTTETNQLTEAAARTRPSDAPPEEVRARMNECRMNPLFAEAAKGLHLPQFFFPKASSGLFDEEDIPFNREELLADFRLSQADSRIDFDALDADAYRVDLEQTGEHDYRPSFWKLDQVVRERLVSYLVELPRESQVQNMTARMVQLIGNMYPIADQEIARYVHRILEAMDAERLRDCIEREHTYRDRIKEKIRELATAHQEQEFDQWLQAGRIHLAPAYRLPEVIHPREMVTGLPCSLYTSEGGMNGEEQEFINEVANLGNVLFWHRIIERQGFHINGFLNHYPDFLIVTRKGNVILAEVKGGDRDNTDSRRKLNLGRTWADRAGEHYSYLMVFKQNPLDGAFRFDEARRIIAQR